MNPESEEYFEHNHCFIRRSVALPKHGNCPAGQIGELVTDTSSWPEGRDVIYICSNCRQEVVIPAPGICT